MERKIITGRLEIPVRGPGGHWYQYMAFYEDDKTDKAYGQTEMEATNTLRRRKHDSR